MDNELSGSLSLYVNTGYHVSNISETITDNLYRGGEGGGIQLIGTSEEVITLSNLAVPGWCVMKNISATGIVDVGPNSGGIQRLLRLKPGKAALVFLYPGVAMMAISDTANTKLWTRCFDAGTGT